MEVNGFFKIFSDLFPSSVTNMMHHLQARKVARCFREHDDCMTYETVAKEAPGANSSVSDGTKVKRVASIHMSCSAVMTLVAL